MNDRSSEGQAGSPYQDRTPKPSPSATTAHGAGGPLNPRSCVTCRKRKVKCDKRHPCSNCTKAHIDCIFPAPGRAPRRPRKPPDNELLARLRRLEGVVQSLGVSVDDDAPPGEINPEHSNMPTVPHDDTPRPRTHRAPHAPQHRSSLDSRFGRLVIEEGKSRYVNNNFWASLNNEVEDLKGILYESSDDDDEPSPGAVPQSTPTHQAFMFNFSSLAVDLHSMHPSSELILLHWQIYEEHCDPLIKMFHAPTMREQVTAVASQPGRSSKGMEVMLFAIYFAAVTSLTPEECEARLGEPRHILVSRYRFCLEQGLARANFLITEELIVLQAFVIYLLCLRRHEDARAIWSLCGLVVRIATTLGLHRDGTDFNLPPFEAEIRRRTWWQICMLDIRTSEDHGCEPTIMEHMYDTKFPLNINDDDLSPSLTDPPKERVGITDMTFSCIRFVITGAYRRLMCSTGTIDETIMEEKERLVLESHQRVEEKYLKYCDMGIPLQWAMATVARLIMAKMWLLVWHPFQRINGGDSLPQATKDRLFVTSLESVEYALLLEKEVRTVKWGWLFRTYHQWHALAFLLTELCRRTKGDMVSRAWRAVDATVVGWGGSGTDSKKNNLWKPLRKLMTKARAARDKQLAFERKLAGETQEPTSWNGRPNQIMPRKPSQSMNLLEAEPLDEEYLTPTMTSADRGIVHMPFQDDLTAIGGNNNYEGNSMLFPTEFLSDSLAFTEPNQIANVGIGSGLVPSHGAGTLPDNGWGMYGGYAENNAQRNGSTTSVNGDVYHHQQQQQQQQQQQHQEGFAPDPLIFEGNGAGGSEELGLPWASFDEMVREFEQENGVAAGSQWQVRRGPLMGDTWL